MCELVQTLHLSAKTACIRFEATHGSGSLWLERGAAVHAVTGDKVGDEALIEIVRWRRGRFVVQDDAGAPRRTITADTMFLLFESLRLADESAAEDPSPSPDEPPAAAPTVEPRRSRLAWAGIAIAGTALTAAALLAVQHGRGRTGAPESPPPARTSASRPPVAGFALARASDAASVSPPEEGAPAGDPSTPDVDPGRAAPRPSKAPSSEPPKTAVAPTALDAPVLFVGPLPEMVAVPPEPAHLVLEIVSRVAAGTVVVEVDGSVAVSQDVAWGGNAAKRMFRRMAGGSGDRSIHRLELEPGARVVTARLVQDGVEDPKEATLEVDLAAASETGYRLIVSRRDDGSLRFREP